MLGMRWPGAERRSVAGGAAEALRLPGLCAVCNGWGHGRLCVACLDRFAAPRLRCARCALPVPTGAPVCGSCIAAPPAYDAAVARVDYEAPWDQLIADFKYHDALDLAPAFAAAIGTLLPALLAASAATTGAAVPSLLLPVPLAAARLRERGYNQAWELARRLGRRLGVAADARLLLRIRDTSEQLALPPEARAGNVRGAFALEPRRRGELRGRSVAVIDDVMTTGSTAAEIAGVLKQAGAAHVAVWVFARTPRPGED